MPFAQALVRKECGLELAVGPAQLATSAYWTLRGASAFVAGKLGTTVTHVLQQHSMLHMTKVWAATVHALTRKPAASIVILVFATSACD